MRALLIIVGVGCKSHAKPLPEAVLGEWEVLCRTDSEAKGSCPGKEDDGLYKILRPGGELEAGSKKTHVVEHGHWQLTGDELELTEEGGGMKLVDRYRAHMDGDHLVLWSTSGFGTVYGRAGAAFEPAATKTTNGGATDHEIGGIRYTISLPGKYRLSRDDNNRQVWSPASGTGFTVRLVAEDEKPPCNPAEYGGTTGASETVEGVERETDIGLSLCLHDHVLACSAGHTRGYLEKTEMDAALLLCKTLRVR